MYCRLVTAESNAAYVGLRREIIAEIPADARLIVDVGAADGTLGRHLLAGRPDRRVIGLEIDPALASTARTRLTDVIDADVATVDWERLVPGSPIDCLVFADVLEHLARPDLTLGHATRRLAADGTVVIALPNVRHLTAWWTIFVRGRFPRRERGLFDRTHLRWFTVADALDLCTDAGLVVASVRYQFRILDRSGGLANRVVAGQRWIRHVPVLRELLAYQIVLIAHLPERRPPDSPKAAVPADPHPTRGRR